MPVHWHAAGIVHDDCSLNEYLQALPLVLVFVERRPTHSVEHIMAGTCFERLPVQV